MLAVVPARGGSKGLPGKNLRLLNGKPLLAHTLGILSEAHGIDGVVVSTDDDEIAAVAQLHGARVVRRPGNLAADDVPVGRVIEHVTRALSWYGPVLTFQPTCPTVTPGDVSAAIACFTGSGYDSLGFVVPDSHLMWSDHGPLQAQRVNRQDLDGHYREVGVFISARVPIGRDPIVGPDHYRFVISDAVDIDTADDFETARRQLSRRSVEFRIVCSTKFGSGHLFRSLQLADELAHDVGFTYDNLPDWAHSRVERYTGPTHDAELVVFDKLDTTETEVAGALGTGAKVVTLEDLGPGARLAHLTINELYDSDGALCGPRWAVLRPEFCGLPPFEVVEHARRVLVCFGGTDPAALSGRVAPIVAREAHSSLLCGPGVEPPDLPLVENVSGPVAALMRDHDLVVCSAGRMAHEAAAAGVPCITLAANERESRHTHCDGILRLGLHATTSNDQIQEAVTRVLHDASLRHEMSTTARAQVDGLGARRIARKLDDLLEGL